MLLETKRCRIREMQEKDIDAFMDYRNNDKWMKYQSFKNKTREEYQTCLLGCCDLNRGVQYAVADKYTDQLIGDIYVKQNDSDCWIGYAIHPLYSRKGYMYEVLSAFIESKCKENVSIMAGTMPENVPSQCLLKKLGFDYVCFDQNDQENIYRYTK